MSCRRLEIRNLTVRLADGSRTLVDDLGLTLEGGGTLALVGESGAGKSMTSLAVMGLLPAGIRRVSGTILVNDRDLAGLDAGRMRRVRGREVAVIMQNPMSAFDPVFTVRAHFRETMLPERGGGDMAAALAEVGLPDPEAILDAYPFQLSGGMLQRVMIALALINAPDYLIADEPTSDLDVLSQRRVLDLIRERRRAMHLGLLLITHDLSVAAHMAEDIAIMHRGRVVEAGAARDVLERPRHPHARELVEAHRRMHGGRFARLARAATSEAGGPA